MHVLVILSSDAATEDEITCRISNLE